MAKRVPCNPSPSIKIPKPSNSAQHENRADRRVVVWLGKVVIQLNSHCLSINANQSIKLSIAIKTDSTMNI
jgi:hypothetical protein